MARRLLLLNGISIVCVILFHATGFGFTAMFFWPHRYRPVVSPNYEEIGTTAYYTLRLMEQFVVFCLPAFLFVSGYFVSVLAGRSRSTFDTKAIGSRIRNLLIPYFLWSMIALLALALQGRILSGSRYVNAFLTGSANPNYYYVILLTQLYLIAPVLLVLAKWNWKVLLLAAAAMQVGVYVLQYVVVLNLNIPILTDAAALPKWLFLSQIFWFTFGVVAGFQSQMLKGLVERVKWMLPATAAALFVLGVVEWELLLRWSGVPWSENRVTLVDAAYALTLILLFLAYTDVEVPFSSSLVELGARSYGIYLVHGLAMEYFSRGLYHFAPWVLGRQLLFQPMLIVLGLAAPLLLMAAVKRLPSRGAYTYLFG
jgi:peptidoglycan/LPS O-acetylase OafA/YrhL